MTSPSTPNPYEQALRDAQAWLTREIGDNAPICSICCTPDLSVVDGECRACAIEMERRAKLTGEDY